MSIFILPQPPKGKTFTITTNRGIHIFFNHSLLPWPYTVYGQPTQDLFLWSITVGKWFEECHKAHTPKVFFSTHIHIHRHTYVCTHTHATHTQVCLMLYHDASLKRCLPLWGSIWEVLPSGSGIPCL